MPNRNTDVNRNTSASHLQSSEKKQNILLVKIAKILQRTDIYVPAATERHFLNFNSFPLVKIKDLNLLFKELVQFSLVTLYF